MTSKRLSKKDLENIVRGACLLSSGGGGTYSSGLNLVDNFKTGSYYEQDYVEYVDVEDLPDVDYVDVEDPDSFTDCGLVVAYMGAPEAIKGLKYPEAAVNAAEKVKALMAEKKQTLAYIVPVEIGALSSIVACTVAAKLGIPVINGDGAGRAVPELTMTTFAGYDVSTNPTVLANKENLTIRLDVDSDDKTKINNAAIVEAAARPTISLDEYGQQAGLAMWVMPAAQIKEVVKITNTLAACKEVGELIAEYQEGTKINVCELLRCINTNLNTKVHELCSGTLCSAENVTEGGFDRGTVVIEGEGKDEGRTLTILVKNENLLAWDSTSHTPLAMAPDAIAYVVYDHQVVYSNGDLMEDNKLIKPLEGCKVSVIGIAAQPELRDYEAKKSKLRANRLQAANDKKGGEIRQSFELALEKFCYYGRYIPLEELQKLHRMANK